MSDKACPSAQAQAQDGASRVGRNDANNAVRKSKIEDLRRFHQEMSDHLEKLGKSPHEHAIFSVAMKCQFGWDSPFGTFEEQIDAVKNSVLKLTAFISGLSFGCKQDLGCRLNFKAKLNEMFEHLCKEPLGPQLCDNVASWAPHKMLDLQLLDLQHRAEVYDIFRFKFYQFSKLPREIRYMIWELAIMGRDRVFMYSRRDDPTSGDYFRSEIDDHHVPACAEARRVISKKKIYTLNGPLGSYFNFERDTFYLRHCFEAIPKDMSLFVPYKSIRNLALDYRDIAGRYMGHGQLLSFLESFEKLEQLTVVISKANETLCNPTRIHETSYFREPAHDDYSRTDSLLVFNGVRKRSLVAAYEWTCKAINKKLDDAIVQTNYVPNTPFKWRSNPFRIVVSVKVAKLPAKFPRSRKDVQYKNGSC